MKAILIDVTKCKGCMSCVGACVEEKGYNSAQTTRGESGLSATQCSTVIRIGQKFAKKSCMHCLEPNCVSACLVGAITKTPDGPVIYDGDKCIGCRYCMLACPYHIPRYEWESTKPMMRKCDMCVEKIKKGDTPACVSTCSHGALEYGERAAIIKRAHERIESRPDRYRDRVWGEIEWGGTSLIYISDTDLADLGWPASRTEAPISSLTDPLIHATSAVGLSVLLGTWGLSAIIQRRTELMQHKETENADQGSATIREENDDAE